MSVQFNVKRIVVTTGEASWIDHDGREFTTPDCPTGTVLAYDADDNLYICTEPFIRKSFTAGRSKKSRKPLTLYRDYWKHVASGADTPYGAAFRNAPHVVAFEQA